MPDSYKTQYILCIDIGNTNTVFGLFDVQAGNLDLKHHWRTVSRRDRTSDELGVYLLGFLKIVGVEAEQISGSIYSSVVPSFNPIVERMTVDYFQKPAIRITNKYKLPFEIDYPRPEEIGADRLVNAAAAVEIYGGNSIVIDMGTATTFCVLKSNVYLGGCIAPGLKISMDTLSKRTAQLPPIEFKRPDSVIGDSTIQALQAGFFYGWVGLFREIIKRTKEESGLADCQVIATGGLSKLIHQEETGLFDEVDPQLTLKGLRLLYDA